MLKSTILMGEKYRNIWDKSSNLYIWFLARFKSSSSMGDPCRHIWGKNNGLRVPELEKCSNGSGKYNNGIMGEY
jgi:hypothetical protein